MSKIRRVLFPEPSRELLGMRWINITLRTLHLIGVTLFVGALLSGAKPEFWEPWFELSLISGLLLIALFCYVSASWIIQLRGVAILLKLLLLYLFWDHPQLLFIIIVVIVISSVVSHAPGSVRYLYLIPERIKQWLLLSQ